MSSDRFHLEWALPLEPGLPTHVAPHDTAGPHRDQVLVGTGDDGAEALLDLLAKVKDAEPDAVTCVTDAYQKRTRRAPRE